VFFDSSMWTTFIGKVTLE